VISHFLLPDLGEGLTEAEIIAWHVAVGDEVSVDQIVVEVETAKAAVEVPCPFAGVVAELHGAVGDVVDVGRPLISIRSEVLADGAMDNRPSAPMPAAPEEPADRARLDAAAKATASANGATKGSGNVLIGYGTPDGDASGRRRRRIVSGFGGHGPARPHGPSDGRSDNGSTGDSVTGTTVSAVSNGSVSSGSPSNASADSLAGRTVATTPSAMHAAATAGHAVLKSASHVAVVSPLVRRLARESGLDLGAVAGSGPEGLIMRRDVEAALATPAAVVSVASVSSAGELERIPLRGLRKAVAEKLSRSRREIPDATTWVDVDATALVELRKRLNAQSDAQRISLLALFARICVAGLTRYPELNSTVDVERQEIVRLRDVNLGFAAQTDRGLVVPVIHGANHLSTEQLAAEFERLTTAARSGSLGVADLTGSTFTLNNYGVYGVDGSTPILNHPEAAMLGVGRIVKKPWVVEGPEGDQLAVRQVTQLGFTFDHRVCDGGVAGGFLRYVADLVEDPARLLRVL
jgi:2-oxoisovalerate dehydrogenase E2 component (dihydrolipoyl transacylase)